MKPIRKAVFPVAGLGTRMLPAAKTVAKEMLTVVDRPLIHHVVAEARETGIEHFIFVTGRGKGALEDYFDHQVELETTLREKNKTEMLDALLADLPREGEISYVRQMQPKGLGHAVWCAREIVGDEPFAVLLPDVIMHGRPGALSQCLSAYARTDGDAVVLVDRVPEGEAHKYGVVALETEDGRLNAMTGMVEKPAPGTEPSRLAISGRYLLPPEIFGVLERQERGAGGEIQLTDAMLSLLHAGHGFQALEFDGQVLDCGHRLGWLRANLILALQRPDMAGDVRAMLAELS